MSLHVIFSEKYSLDTFWDDGTGQIHSHVSSFIHYPVGSLIVLEVDLGFW